MSITFKMEMATDSAGVVGIGLLDANDDVAIDDADALLLRKLEAVGGYAVELAQVPATGLMHQRCASEEKTSRSQL